MPHERSLAATCLVLMSVACDPAPTVPSQGSLNVPSRNVEAPIQTDRLEYQVREVDRGFRVEIPFSYENRTGQLVSVVNCNGDTGTSLEKRPRGEWIHAWGAVVRDCLSAPIEISPGESHSDTVHFFAGHPSSNNYPKLEVDELEGRYRIVWHRVVHDYDPVVQGFGTELSVDERTSNEFVLTRK